MTGQEYETPVTPKPCGRFAPTDAKTRGITLANGLTAIRGR